VNEEALAHWGLLRQKQNKNKSVAFIFRAGHTLSIFAGKVGIFLIYTTPYEYLRH
jgi:hypothetical protein